MTDYDKLEEQRQMARSNYYAQLAMMGYDSGGNPLDDVVCVVRCRDCLYFCDMSGTGKTDICSYHSVMGPDGEIDSPFYTTPEAYCAWAERRDEE